MLHSSAFTHQYNGDVYNGSNPRLTGPGASYTETPGDISVWSPATDSDVLSFRNTEADGGGYFTSDNWASNYSNSLGWTVEFRLQVGTDATEGAQQAFDFFGKETNLHGTNSNSLNQQTRRVWVTVGQQSTVIRGSASGSVLHTETADNTDGFHEFRIAQPASSGQITVWRDGVQIYAGNSDGSNNNLGAFMFFGDGGGAIGGPTVSLDYFRWDSTGAYEPVPEPHSLAMLGLAIFSSLGCRRRNLKGEVNA
jgi:hypothetical protein